MVNESALIADRKNKNAVEVEDVDQARDKFLMGIDREDMVTEKEKAWVAYHEAGHTLVAELLPNADPLEKVTIIPGGRSLGATEQLPEENRYHLKRDYLMDRIAILLAGRVAERIRYGDISSGAADDLKKATQLARRMVCQWGMSDTVGPMVFNTGDSHPFLGT